MSVKFSKQNPGESGLQGKGEAATSWVYQGAMIPGIGSPFAPALATHGQTIFCLFQNQKVSALSYSRYDFGAWGSPALFINTPDVPSPRTICPPALADDGRTLHAVFVDGDTKNDLVHYRFDDASNSWGQRYGLAQHASRQPALAAYHGKLFCVFMADGGNDLLYTIWDQAAGWSSLMYVKTDVQQQTAGAPALFVLNDTLYLLFAQNGNEKVVELGYDESKKSWYQVTPPNELANSGISAVSFGGQAFMGFVKNGGSNILISEYNGTWLRNEDTTQLTSDTPALAISGGYANCAFIANNASRELVWMRRTVPAQKIE